MPMIYTQKTFFVSARYLVYLFCRQSAEVVAGGDVTADFPGSPAKKKRKTVQFESSVMCDESHTSTATEPGVLLVQFSK